jgi:pimeloyl-ACP methyl ester carboxylesterase
LFTSKELVMPHLTRHGVRLSYEDHGRGLPILLSHGFGASTRMWRGQVEAFQDAYQLVLWDRLDPHVARPGRGV